MEKVRVISIVRARPDPKYEFCVRWFLDKLDRLPLPGDKCKVKVEWLLKASSSRYLKSDGTFGDPGVEASIEVVPLNYFMLDPPRKEEAVDQTLPDVKWSVAQTPTKPIDKDLTLPKLPTDPWPADEGFGVIHLLKSTHPARAEWLVAKKLAELIEPAISSVTQSHKELEGCDTKDIRAEALAQHFAYQLVRFGPRAKFLPQHLAVLTRQLRAAAASKEREVPFPSGLISYGERSFLNRWFILAIAVQLFSKEELQQELEKIITVPEQVRQAVGLRLIQGGNLIDYWCNPTGSTATCKPEDRGKQYPTSEVLGLGLTIGQLSADDVRSLADTTKSLGVTIHVEHVPQEVMIDPITIDEGLSMHAENEGALSPGCYPIETGELASLLNGSNSTLPPLKPVSSKICWDMIQTNAGTAKTGNEDPFSAPCIGYLTGDARVEILIQAPKPTPPPAGTCIESGTSLMRVGGFNVYGIWESSKDPDAQPYFADPNKIPTLSELKKRWLVTRRYSGTRDLAKAFEAGTVTSALDTPPWMSLWHRDDNDNWYDGEAHDRAKATLDERAKAAAEMPNIINRHFTTHTLDLRLGVTLQPNPAANPTPPWDSRGYLNINWTPERDRDFQSIPNPQRYRFFVTTVDSFEQESEPIPVWTNDPDAGDPVPSTIDPAANRHIFQPQRRAALLPPPEERERNICPTPTTVGKGRGLKFDKDAMKLYVWWETPYLAENAGYTTEDKPLTRATTADLIAAVAVYRRSLRGKIESDREQTTLRRARVVLTDPTTYPQWQAEVDRLHREGWVEAPGMKNLSIDPPQNGDVWLYDKFDVRPWIDQGFEYVALVSVRVKDTKRQFWVRDVIGDGGSRGRHVQLVKKKSGDPPFELIDAWITETPASSDAVATGIEPVPNNALPRKAIVVSTKFHEALPVLPAPGIFRDAVLLRLLSNPFKDPASSEPKPITVPYPSGSPDPVMVTPGQREMIEGALERTREIAAGANLIDTRSILAADFRKPVVATEAKEYGLNPTVGFRGLNEITFSYSPFSAGPDPNNEAEASKFRIYSMRVPRDIESARPYATVYIPDATKNGDQFSFSFLPTDPQWTKLLPILPLELSSTDFGRAAASKPAVVRVQTTTETAFDATILSIRYEEQKVKLSLKFAETSPPNVTSVKLFFFLAQPIHEIQRPTKSFRTEHYEVFLPVGGGEREIFAWWIVSVSAQDKEAGHDETGRQSITLIRDYQTTQPATPQFFTIIQPADAANHWQDPNNAAHRKWMPSEVSTIDLAKTLPRLVALWQPTTQQGNIAISRKRRRINADSFFRLAERDLTAWKALVKIEGATPQELLEISDLNALNRWLRGDPVDLPNEGSAITEEPWHISPQDKMELTGVKAFDFQGIPGGRAQAFIDYYLENRESHSSHVMDGNFEYEYRAMSYVDLGESLPLKWRFLYSRPTPWSGYHIPDTLAFEVRLENESQIENTEGPRVLLKFRVNQTRRRLMDDLVWSYRVIVRRKSPFALRSSSSVDPAEGWLVVGQPLTLQQSGWVEATDDMIERVSPTEALRLNYEILVSQFSAGSDGTERLVRAPSNPVTKEVIIPVATLDKDQTSVVEFLIG